MSAVGGGGVRFGGGARRDVVGGRDVASRLAARRGDVVGEAVDPEDELHSASLRRTLARSEGLLDAAVGPSRRADDDERQRETIMDLNVAVGRERKQRVAAEDALRETEQLMALKLEDLKALARRVKRLEGENELQVALEQESQKTFEYLGNEVGGTKAQVMEDVVALRGELARELTAVRTAVAAHEQATAQQSDQLMVWLEKEAQEVCNVRARMDALARRTNAQLERQTAQVEGLRTGLNRVAADAKEDAIALSGKVSQVKTHLHSVDQAVATAGVAVTTPRGMGGRVGGPGMMHVQAVSPAVPGSGRMVNLSDIRHQEVQQEIASV